MKISPQITVDYSKCTTPFNCKKCLQICPPGVFWLVTVKSVRGKETDKNEPGAYRVEVRFRDRCTGCMDCVESCPLNAIVVNTPYEVMP